MGTYLGMNRGKRDLTCVGKWRANGDPGAGTGLRADQQRPVSGVDAFVL
jgi:hypothetical protein